MSEPKRGGGPAKARHGFEDYPTVQQLFGDDVVKHLLSAQAHRQFEVASFRSLSTAAETIGDSQFKAMCDHSVDEKKRLAARFEESLPQITRDYQAQVH